MKSEDESLEHLFRSPITTLTKRELFAMAFMQAIINKAPHEKWASFEERKKANTDSMRAIGAVMYADALIKELEESDG